MTSRSALWVQSTLVKRDYELLAEKIKAEMRRAQVTDEDLAFVLGKSVQTVRNRLAGRRPWRIDELGAVGQLIDRPVSHLLLDLEMMKPA